MAADGVKKEEELINNDPKPILLLDDHHQNMNIINNHAENINNNNNNKKKKGISIAERRAAKCGFNASNINTARPAAYFTIPSGISPSALLDSPVMLPNAQAQLSPTTGTFQFPSPNHESLKLKLKLASNGDNSVAMEAQGNNIMRVENKSFEELEYPRDFQEMTNKDSCFGGTTTHVNTDQVLGNKSREADITTNLQPNTTRNQQILSKNNNNNTVDHTNVIKERNTNSNQKGSYFTKEVAKYSEDGFYWRKYGQKHVKGSEYPRSYYKCTNANCPVKKKVERSHDGQITEIVYKGSHNHPKPQPVKRFGDVLDQMSCDQGTSSCFKTEGGAIPSAGKLDGDWRGGDHSLDNGLACSTSFMSTDHLSDPTSRTMNAFEPVDPTAQEISSTFGSQDCDDNNVQNEASPESTSFNDEDDENGENEPKKRKRESFPSETSIPRSTREPRVVVQIESDIDILDDGYRWRKYGQKVVKGNPNPRSYYKCTTPGCPVRKHVERAANDIKSVITTYEGKHNHDVPSSKTGSLVISDVANLPPAVTNSTLNSSQLGQKNDHHHHHHHHHHHVSKTGKQVQDHNLPLYLERKPMLNYNELMRSSNLPGNFSSDLSFGTSSVYPLSFPPFHSLPYGSLLMNGNNNHMKSTSYNHNPSSNLYPMLPDYMSLQSQINTAGSANVGNFHHFNNYGGGAAAATAIQGQEKNIVKPKEEQRDESELYDTCLSIPNHGNGTI